MFRNGIPSSSVNPTQEDLKQAHALGMSILDYLAAKQAAEEVDRRSVKPVASSAASMPIAAAAELSEEEQLRLAMESSLKEQQRLREMHAREEAAVRDAMARSIPKPIISRPATPDSEDEELARVLAQSALEQQMAQALEEKEKRAIAAAEEKVRQEEAARAEARLKEDLEKAYRESHTSYYDAMVCRGAAAAQMPASMPVSQNKTLFDEKLSPYLVGVNNGNLAEAFARLLGSATILDVACFDIIFESSSVEDLKAVASHLSYVRQVLKLEEDQFSLKIKPYANGFRLEILFTNLKDQNTFFSYIDAELAKHATRARLEQLEVAIGKAKIAVSASCNADDLNKDLYEKAVFACNAARELENGIVAFPSHIISTQDLWQDNYKDVKQFDFIVKRKEIFATHRAAMQALNNPGLHAQVETACTDAFAKLAPEGEYKNIISKQPEVYQQMRDQLTICYQDHHLIISAELQKQQQIKEYLSFIHDAYSRIKKANVTLNAAKDNLADDELYKQVGDTLNDAKIFANSKSRPNSNFIEIENNLMSNIARIEGEYNDFSNKRALVLQLQTNFIANVAARANNFHAKITATAAIQPDAVTLFLDEFNPKLQAAKVALTAAQAKPLDAALYQKLEDAKSAITSDDVKNFVKQHAADSKLLSLKAELKDFINQCKAFDVSRPELQRVAPVQAENMVHDNAPGLVALVEDNLGHSASASKVSQPEGSLFNKVGAWAADLFSSKPLTQAKPVEPQPVQPPAASSSDASSSSAVAGGLFKGSAKWWTATTSGDR